MNTPWGTAQTETEYADGITFVTTASHGGFVLSPARVAQIPSCYRAFAAKWSKGYGDRYYEEDCAALAILITWPALLGVSPHDVPGYKAQLDHWCRELVGAH